MVEKIQPNSIKKVIKVIEKMEKRYFTATDIYYYEKINYNTIKNVLVHLSKTNYLEYNETMLAYSKILVDDDGREK